LVDAKVEDGGVLDGVVEDEVEALARRAEEVAVGGGGGMRLLEARLVLKSPAIVTQRRLERGFVKPADHIPGSTLRGAILASLYRAGKLSADDLRREAEEPSLLASPAYPVVGSSRSVPATPFMFLLQALRSLRGPHARGCGEAGAGRELEPPLPPTTAARL